MTVSSRGNRYDYMLCYLVLLAVSWPSSLASVCSSFHFIAALPQPPSKQTRCIATASLTWSTPVHSFVACVPGMLVHSRLLDMPLICPVTRDLGSGPLPPASSSSTTLFSSVRMPLPRASHITHYTSLSVLAGCTPLPPVLCCPRLDTPAGGCILSVSASPRSLLSISHGLVSFTLRLPPDEQQRALYTHLVPVVPFLTLFSHFPHVCFGASYCVRSCLFRLLCASWVAPSLFDPEPPNMYFSPIFPQIYISSVCSLLFLAPLPLSSFFFLAHLLSGHLFFHSFDSLPSSCNLL